MARRITLVINLCFAPVAIAVDGQSFKASDEEMDRVWNDPNCERTAGSKDLIDWDMVRQELHGTPYPASIPFIGDLVQRLDVSAILHEEVLMCPFGVISILFFFVKFLIEGPEPKLGTARVYYSLLDSFYSGMHPNLLDRGDWLVKDSRISALRRALLGRQRPASETPGRRPLIYVYDKEVPEVRELSQGASFCGKGQWGMEVHIHEWLVASSHLTRDPAKADFFFVPAYSICMFRVAFSRLLSWMRCTHALFKAYPITKEIRVVITSSHSVLGCLPMCFSRGGKKYPSQFS